MRAAILSAFTALEVKLLALLRVVGLKFEKQLYITISLTLLWKIMLLGELFKNFHYLAWILKDLAESVRLPIPFLQWKLSFGLLNYH